MAKESGARPLAKGSGTRKGTAGKASGVRRSGATGHFMTVHEGCVEAVMAAAERSGLLHGKSGRIGGRVSPALLAGIVSRLQGYARDAKLKALQDCTLFLQAQKLGFTVLTANIAEFDPLLQLVPTGRALFYRADARSARGS